MIIEEYGGTSVQEYFVGDDLLSLYLFCYAYYKNVCTVRW